MDGAASGMRQLPGLAVKPAGELTNPACHDAGLRGEGQIPDQRASGKFLKLGGRAPMPIVRIVNVRQIGSIRAASGQDSENLTTPS